MKKSNRQKIITLIAITILIGVAGQGIYSRAESNVQSAIDSDINVVATTHILRDFAQEIIGDEGKVSVIIESGSCPGHYDYSPSDINVVENADIVFYHGFEWEGGLGSLLEEAGNTEAGFGMIQNSSISFTDQWGSPANAPLFLDVICDHLYDTYPLLNETFNDNKDAYLAKLEGYKTYYELKINTTYKWRNKNAFVMKHQKSFMEWLGFNVSGSNVWDLDDNSMTPSDITNIMNNASQHGAEIVVGNYQSGRDIGKEIANDLGIESTFLTNFPGVYGIDTYLGQIEFNVALLHHVINGGPDPRPYNSDTIGANLLVPLMVCVISGIALVIYMKRKSLFS